MSKHRKTGKNENKQSEKFRELPPMMGGGAIFRRSRSRSVNSPEVSLAHESLTAWLNGENSGEYIDAQYRNSPESTKRIFELFELVRSVTTAFEHQAPRLYPYAYGKTREPHEAREEASQRRREMGTSVQFGAISAALADYATVPYLAFQPSTKLWGIGQWPVAPPGYHHNGVMQMLQPTLRPYGEVMAAHGILELVRRCALCRIAFCVCKRWYFKKRKDSVACSDTCRKLIHDRKPEVIERRRNKRKDNYKLHQSGSVKEVSRRAMKKTNKTGIQKVKRNG
jgi:hypothetical protein